MLHRAYLCFDLGIGGNEHLAAKFGSVFFFLLYLDHRDKIFTEFIYILNMLFYLEMPKNITKQRDIYDAVIFRFLQICCGLTMKRKV